MQSRLVLALALFVAIASAQLKVIYPKGIPESDIIPDEYIVRLTDGIGKKDFESHINTLLQMTGIAKAEVLGQNSDFGTYSAKFNPLALLNVLRNPAVSTVEANYNINTVGTTSSNEVEAAGLFDSIFGGGKGGNDKCLTQTLNGDGSQWGQDRIDGKIDGKFKFPTEAGVGVDVHVLDTGARLTHEQFSNKNVGRFLPSPAYLLADFNVNDCNGQGTAVAATIGGRSVGIAPGANITTYKIGKCNGGTSYAVLLGTLGVVGLTSIQTKNITGRPQIIHLSYTMPQSNSTDQLINLLTLAGVVVVTAGGDTNSLACELTPPAASTQLLSGVISVGASTRDDKKYSTSNWGRCISIFAPGDGIQTATVSSSSNTAYALRYGTPIAAAHVTGAAALHLSRNPKASPIQVKLALAVSSQSAINNGCGLAGWFTECGRTPTALVKVAGCGPFGL